MFLFPSSGITISPTIAFLKGTQGTPYPISHSDVFYRGLVMLASLDPGPALHLLLPGGFLKWGYSKSHHGFQD